MKFVEDNAPIPAGNSEVGLGNGALVGCGVEVGGTGVAEGGTRVGLGSDVKVGRGVPVGFDVAVGGTAVGLGMAVGGTAVAVGGTGVGGTGTAVGAGAHAVARTRARVRVPMTSIVQRFIMKPPSENSVCFLPGLCRVGGKRTVLERHVCKLSFYDTLVSGITEERA